MDTHMTTGAQTSPLADKGTHSSPGADRSAVDELKQREQEEEQLHAQLMRQRQRVLDELVRENAEREGADSYGALAGEVTDSGEASVATEQSDMRHAHIGRDLAELRQVDAALARFDDGSYGICSHCGQQISTARLHANPAAERCIVCQTAFERQYAEQGGVPITRKV